MKAVSRGARNPDAAHSSHFDALRLKLAHTRCKAMLCCVGGLVAWLEVCALTNISQSRAVFFEAFVCGCAPEECLEVVFVKFKGVGAVHDDVAVTLLLHVAQSTVGQARNLDRLVLVGEAFVVVADLGKGLA